MTWCVAFSLGAATAEAQTYRIDPAKSEIVARTFKAGLASGMAHDHIVRASKLSGELQLEAKKVSITVDARSLIADEPEMRQKHHLKKSVADGDRKRIQATMLGDGQLDAEKYPVIAFESTRIEAANDRFAVTGRLTLHGQTKIVSFGIETKVEKGVFRARGRFTLKQSDFGIEPYSAALGAVQNKDEVEISFFVVAAPE
ncbi:MAG: YceI family protein [Deltaproteobacteria bacterium]|nr:YceI family protein [Deltaproteobacteria bacterium]